MQEPTQPEPVLTPSVPIPGRRDQRSTMELVRDIAADSSTLVRKEVELAKQELMEAVVARLMGAGALAAAGLFAIFLVGFLGLAAAAALDLVRRAHLV